MALFISIPVLYIATLFQMVAISRLPLIRGSADLVMLVLVAWGIIDSGKNYWGWGLVGGLIMSFVTKVPWPAIILSYVLVTFIAHLMQRRIWQSPILAMLLMALLGTLVTQFSAIFALSLNDVPLIIGECFSSVMVPSIILNLILSVPVYIVINDIAKWVYPGIDHD